MPGFLFLCNNKTLQGQVTSGSGLAAPLEGEADVVCPEDLALQVIHQLFQGFKGFVGAMEEISPFLHLDLEVLVGA